MLSTHEVRRLKQLVVDQDLKMEVMTEISAKNGDHLSSPAPEAQLPRWLIGREAARSVRLSPARLRPLARLSGLDRFLNCKPPAM